MTHRDSYTVTHAELVSHAADLARRVDLVGDELLAALLQRVHPLVHLLHAEVVHLLDEVVVLRPAGHDGGVEGDGGGRGGDSGGSFRSGRPWRTDPAASLTLRPGPSRGGGNVGRCIDALQGW